MERRTNKKENTLPKNLPKVAKDALKDLSSRYEIIIFKADKGGAAEIIDNDNCINKAKRQLNNAESYKEIPNDLTETNSRKVNEKINKLKSARRKEVQEVLQGEKKFKDQESKTLKF